MPVDFSNASRPFQQYQWTLSVVPVDLFITIHFFQFPASSYFIVCVSAAALHVSVSPSQRGAARRHAVRFTSVQTVPPKGLYILTYRAWLETVILLPRHRRTVVQNMNRDGSTGPLARLFTWTAHFFACFAMLTLLAHSLSSL